MTRPNHCPTCGAFPVDVPAPPTDALVEALDKALELLSVPEHAQDEAWERKYYEVVEVHNRYVPKDGQTHAEPPAATVPESIHEAADIILEVADYINDACNDSTGILGSKSVDPLMRAHALLGDAAPQSGKKEDGWLPIETAPKDGTLVLVGWRDSDLVISALYAQGDDVEKYWYGYVPALGLMNVREPHLWMPLPSPPSKAEGET